MSLHTRARVQPGAVHRTVPAVVLAVVAAGSWLAVPATAAQASPAAVPANSAGGWGTAEEVPGLAALDNGGQALDYSVSCASAGNCATGGGAGNGHAFVADQTNGTWGTAQEVRGASNGVIMSVSCAAPGDCGAGGLSRTGQVFVVGETHGTWGKAEQVPGIAALNTGDLAWIYSVSCASPGNCGTGGYYTDSAGHAQAFVASERNGVWGTAQEVPGTAAANQGGFALVYSVSCASAGNCSAGGFYTDGSFGQQAFVVDETNGVWGTAREVPGTAVINTDGDAAVTAVSCTSVGNCSAGGYYGNAPFTTSAFVVNETHGTWGTAQKIPGTALSNRAGGQGFLSMSCPSAGNCGAGGVYIDSAQHNHGFVLNETNGTWGGALSVHGPSSGGIDALSCSSAGNCSAGGNYSPSRHVDEAFVVDERNGTWGRTQEVPGTATLNAGGLASVYSVSCTSTAHCTAVGMYFDSARHDQAFVVTRT